MLISFYLPWDSTTTSPIGAYFEKYSVELDLFNHAAKRSRKKTFAQRRRWASRSTVMSVLI